MAEYEPTSAKDANAVRRYTHRAKYDEATLFKILDEGAVAHVTFQLPVDPDGLANDDWPHPPIPMAYGRIDDTIYLHGYIHSQLLGALSKDDVKCCITVTTIQGFVIALAPYHNDVNFRSACIFSHAKHCQGDEAVKGLKAITNEIWRNVGYDRWEDCRQPTSAEYQATRVISARIERASCKIGGGNAQDDKDDVAKVSDKYWSGVIKRQEKWTHAVPASYCQLPEPQYVKDLLAKAA